jgi:histidyl-tRNA synthetase
VLAGLAPLVAGSDRGQQGAAELADLLSAVAAAGVPSERIRLDVAIARGLDYYTGTIYETYLDDLPKLGSVCSGGRYDDLASLYTRQELPGVGASLGLDRLLAGMEELGMADQIATPAPIIIPYFVESRLADYLRLASLVRKAGFGVEVYPDAKRLGQQLKYADRRGFRVALILGDDELAQNVCQLKDLASGESVTVSLAENASELILALRERLGPGERER